MNNCPLFSGIFPALVSPVTSEGSVMESELRALVRYFAESRVQGLYVCGGTGEGILLPVSTRKRILEVVIDEVKRHPEHQLQVLAHIGAAEAVNTRELVLHAESIGVDAISTIPPIYFSYSRDRICEYFAWVSGLSKLPVIIYASAQAGVPFTADMLTELCAYPTIRGIKFTGYNFFELMRMRDVVPNDFSILNGGDEVLLFGFLAGANGGVGATYNVMPNLFCQVYEAWNVQDIPLARELQRQINMIIGIIIQYPVIGAIKVMLQAQGLSSGETVFPNESLDENKKNRLLKQLEEANWREVCK
ncbi:MAG: dihydrodipicolinate synthase family protein [Sphaerochaeta sp.]|nr:dihydrodipicolinate synthase family protein [Sphaerochaeta sp.]